MNVRQLDPRTLWKQRAKYLRPEVGLTVLTLIMIAAFHSAAAEDRLLLNLYYIAILASAYSLVMRRSLALMVVVVFVAAGTTLGGVFLAPKPGGIDPLVDPVVDACSLFILLLLGWRLAVEAYRFQSEEHRMRIQREIEEKALATRAAALTSTSHEVRQPLTAILTISEMLLDGSAGTLNETQREFVTDVDDCAKHLMNLINDLLDYAKAEAGKITLAVESVALPELINQCVSMVEAKAAHAEINIAAQVEPEAREIVADPLRLKQIILNLLTNAIKFNEKGGFVKMQVRGDGKGVLISVRDTGRGIAPDKLDKLFDPYYQAANGDQGIGTGLGLSIIKHLVELHGGLVSVESVVGSGSVFSIRLPRMNVPGDQSEARSFDELPREGVGVLATQQDETLSQHPVPSTF